MKLHYKSPIGVVEIIGNDEFISSILFLEQENPDYPLSDETPHVLKECYSQLHEYFTGDRTQFTIPYQMAGTDFQNGVWDSLTKVPYGETASYRDIAITLRNEKATRAVGLANGRNRLSIIIPCHRIIGSNGKLTGYAGGLWRKDWLLQHEKNKKV